MWQNERKRTIIRNIILALVTIAVLCGLGFAMLKVSDRTKEEDAQLVDVYSQHQQEQTEQKQQNIQSIDLEYEKDMETLAEYMPGIVCWGDTITAGTSGNVSYPDELQKYINTYICDIYDFKSSIENADEYPRQDWTTYTIEIPVVNLGGGNESTTTILGRSGVAPYVLLNDVVIPANTDPVEISLVGGTAEMRTSVYPLSNGNDNGINPVSINGIIGTLSTQNNYGLNQYYFTRSEAGAEMIVTAGTEVVTSVSEMYKDYIHVICIGTYGGYANEAELVEHAKALVARQTLNSDRYIVIGICSMNGVWGNFDSYDEAMLQAFGNHYINLRKYLCSDGLTDAKITGTTGDEQRAKNGIVPVALRSAAGDAGFNAKVYSLIGKLVYERMDKLGYFAEIEEELYIAQARKEILKENSNYFTNLLGN